MPRNGSFSVAGRGMYYRCMAILIVLLLTACAPMQTKTSVAPAAEENIGSVEVVTGEPKDALTMGKAKAALSEQPQALPVRFQQPSYLISQMEPSGMDEDVVIPVGADISTNAGPVPLKDIIKRLASLKKMNVSWASDVDQNVLTDVDIRAGDDFFQAIDNLLRQVDYFHEVQGNTIVIKYKETKKFHVAMPPRLASIASSTSTGSSASTSLSVDTDKNRWDDVRKNLDQILDIWKETTTTAPTAAEPKPTGYEVKEAPATSTKVTKTTRSGKGYYSINEGIGLITVTAPRPLIAKIAEYIENLKEELYRQISIEAKIVEVILDDTSTSGLNWNDLLNDMPINVQLFDGTGIIYPHNNTKIISQVAMPASFDVILDAISEHGKTKVLANPKVSVMNGQPAVIYVGDNVTYIDKVETTIDEGVITTSVTTNQATSGIRLEVYPTIINDNEIILSLTPMISGLNKDIEYRQFGIDSEVGLPEIRERTMNSIVRINNGQLLVVGGLIDRSDGTEDTKVQLLGDLPVINKLFKATAKAFHSKELVILLRPEII
jgi:MSHA type pilus biogenesis protein MshL